MGVASSPRRRKYASAMHDCSSRSMQTRRTGQPTRIYSNCCPSSSFARFHLMLLSCLCFSSPHLLPKDPRSLQLSSLDTLSHPSSLWSTHSLTSSRSIIVSLSPLPSPRCILVFLINSADQGAHPKQTDMCICQLHTKTPP